MSLFVCPYLSCLLRHLLRRLLWRLLKNLLRLLLRSLRYEANIGERIRVHLRERKKRKGLVGIGSPTSDIREKMKEDIWRYHAANWSRHLFESWTVTCRTLLYLRCEQQYDGQRLTAQPKIN